MVKKRIVILSLTLLCSTIVRATAIADEKGLEEGKKSTPSTAPEKKNPGDELASAKDKNSEGKKKEDEDKRPVPPSPTPTDPVAKKEELVQAALPSRIAALEKGSRDLMGSLESSALSAAGRKVVEAELLTHKNLTAIETKALAAKVTDILKGSENFIMADVLAVMTDCHDSQNRAAIVDQALGNLFTAIADLNAKAGQAKTADERATLSTQRAGLEKMEAALSLAKESIVAAPSLEVEDSGNQRRTLFNGYVSLSNHRAVRAVEAAAVVGVCTVGAGVLYGLDMARKAAGF